MIPPQGPAGIPGKGPAPRVDPKGRSTPSPGTAKGEFSRLLEKLRSLEESAKAGKLAGEKKEKALDPAALLGKLEEAERTFRKAMEIRKDLEAAWRARGKGPYGQSPPGGEGGN